MFSFQGKQARVEVYPVHINSPTTQQLKCIFYCDKETIAIDCVRKNI